MQINIKQIERVAKWGFASLFSIVGILFLLFLSSEWLCPEFWGSQNVGKNLYLLHWERDTYLFVYSTDVHGRTCYHGAPIIPSYKNDEYANTFVKKWGYTDKWIALIAYNFANNRNEYFIVEKNYDTDAKKTFSFGIPACPNPKASRTNPEALPTFCRIYALELFSHTI